MAISTHHDTALKRDASLLDVVMLGAGAAIGSSIFSVLGPAAGVAGSGLLLAIGVAMVPMLLLGMVYAFMASAAPRTGASYEWPREFVGTDFAFFIAWLRILGSVSMLVVMSFVLIRYMSSLIPLPPTPIMLAIFTALYVLNLRGISFAAKAQTMMMILLLVAFGIFLACGVAVADFGRIAPLLPAGPLPLLLALPLLIQLFQGIETSTEIGEEVRDAERAIPRGIALAVLLTLVVYIAIATMALALVGPAALASSTAPLMTAANAVPGRLTASIMLLAATLCLVKSLNVSFMIFARNLFAMARSGILPSPLGRIHPRWGTPHVASTAVYVAVCLGLLLPKNLVYLFIATSVPTLLKYASTCLSAIRVIDRRPDVCASARLRIPLPRVRLMAWAGMIAAVGIALAGVQLDWKPYLLLAGWAVIGQVYWFWRRPFVVSAGAAARPA